MQSNKPSKKTQKTASEPSAAKTQQISAAEPTARPRVSRSTRTKKSETVEAIAVKHHHKVPAPVVPEIEIFTSAVQTTPAAAPAHRHVSHSDIAELAYFYWMERGSKHGNPEDDWIRAEQALRGSL